MRLTKIKVMGIVSGFEVWKREHHHIWVDFLRIILGIILFARGIEFIRDTSALETILKNSRFEFVPFMIAHYVAFAHLVGGLLIMLGLLTKVAVAFQIPVLLGAIIFVNSTHGFFSANNPELGYSILVLFLLLFFQFYGSGYLSLDRLMKKYKDV